jgi:Tol biopolymer transport system component
LVLILLMTHGLAHYASPLPQAQIAKPARQFGLPFAGAPGPKTWLLAQLYGNTTGAYTQRRSGYGAGQGIHFGLDISARCGTSVLAIGDGVISEVDGPHGSPPHNLIIEHAGNLSSFYGHLRDRPGLKVGTRVKRGQVVALSGDSQGTCTGAPHLHLEIRDRSHQRFFNPMAFIAADWDTIVLAGGFGARSYQRDLANPRKWQQPDNQPSAQRGGALLNDYALTWPPVRGSAKPLPSLEGNYPGLKAVQLRAASSETPAGPRRLTSGGCCVGPLWSPDSSTVLFLDKPEGGPVGYYGVSVLQPQAPKLLLPVAFYSPDFGYAVHPGASTLIQRMSDGARIRLDTSGGNLSWGPKGQVVWQVMAQEGNFDRRSTRVFVGDLEGNTLQMATSYGGGFSGWLDENTVLLSGKSQPSDALRRLETLDLQSGARKLLTQALGLRSLSISPDRNHIAYYVAFDTPERNGMFVVSKSGERKTMPWFGSYRWRDGKRIVYIALALSAQSHVLREYDLQTGQTRVLADLGTKVSNDQWQVSPDGKRVVFVDTSDRNLWVTDLP